MSPRFIVVDDDPINNRVCSYAISKAAKSTDIKCFEFPSEGLKFILSEYGDESKELPTVLLLDISMPEINGWDFLNEFAKMDEHIQMQFTICIVTSSVDPSDIEKAKANVFVRRYLEKPLKPEIVSHLLRRYD
ncbi:MAG TPA: response regulator [Chitinophagales bacterium]|nr:response regulator [Chitinophagales bacterium]